jgi:putative intracellular protease/amidase
MHNFVATHFAERATELLPAIDKLTSVERIARSLKDYEALVAPAGKAAARHLMDLRATLTRR